MCSFSFSGHHRNMFGIYLAHNRNAKLMSPFVCYVLCAFVCYFHRVRVFMFCCTPLCCVVAVLCFVWLLLLVVCCCGCVVMVVFVCVFLFVVVVLSVLFFKCDCFTSRDIIGTGSTYTWLTRETQFLSCLC